MEFKNILVIEGSNRHEGFTRKMVKEALEAVKSEGVQYFNTFTESFSPCDGCNYCEASGVCRHRDLDEFFQAFETADLVIFASPVYNGFFSSPMKKLIDRFQVYYSSFYAAGKVQKIKKHRSAVLLTASGCDGKYQFDSMEKALISCCSILNLSYIGGVLCAFTDSHPDMLRLTRDIKELFLKGASGK